MKLKSSPTSPYVRKVLVTAIETGLRERIETTDVDTSKAEETRSAENPLGKIPALTTDDGAVLFDSPVICEYLASLAETGAVFPPRGEARWTALRRQALADGILDASLFRRYEGMRPEGLRSDEWSARQKGKVERALDALEAEADTLGDGITIGHIALGCALGYLDFRFAGDDLAPGPAQARRLVWDLLEAAVHDRDRTAGVSPMGRGNQNTVHVTTLIWIA